MTESIRFMAGAAMLAVALGACGGSSSSAKPSPTPSPVSVSSCPKVKKVISVPSNFPRRFPLHSGTQLTRTYVGPFQTVVIEGFAQLKTFATQMNFFETKPPMAGFKKTEGDAEPPHEAEGQYRGNGFVRRWLIRALPNCGKALLFEASAKRL